MKRISKQKRNTINEYIKWYKKSGSKLSTSTASDNVIQTIEEVEKIFPNILKNNSLSIRKKAAELILNRNKYNIDAKLYIKVLLFLISYSEFQDFLNPKEHQTKSKISKEVQSDALATAYYFSRVNDNAVINLEYTSHTEALKKMAAIIGVKYSTLKNMRDEFDPYFNNGRAGWYQRDLSESRKEIFDYFSSFSDDELTNYIRNIVNKYTSVQTKPSTHRRIQISDISMKEIKVSKQK